MTNKRPGAPAVTGALGHPENSHDNPAPARQEVPSIVTNDRSIDAVCIGLLVADLFVPPLARLPSAGELIATDPFLVEVGGCAANTAIALGRLGASAAVVGAIGEDAFGASVKGGLEARGVNIDAVQGSGLPTSQTVIIPVRGEDRRYLHSPGANATLAAAHIPADLVGRARVVAVGGYLGMPALRGEELGEILRVVRQAGVSTVLDVIVPAGSDPVVSELIPLLPHVDFFVPNEDEARALTGASDPAHQAAALLELGAQAVVITRGAGGALYSDGSDTWIIDPLPVDVVDSSGAGDAFVAGLVSGLLQDWSIDLALRLAAAVGALSCTTLGCTAGIPTLADATRFAGIELVG